jgi:hypothetical protein
VLGAVPLPWPPIWLTALAVAAWAVPTSSGRLSAPLIGLTLVVACLLFAVGLDSILGMLVVALAAGGDPCLRPHYTNRGAWRTLAHAFVLSALRAAVAIVGSRGAFRPVVADQDGIFGAMPDPVPDLVPYTTTSGLRLTHPSNGGDQCWNVMLCTPTENPQIRMRGTTVADGFATAPQESDSSSRRTSPSEG